MMYTCGNNRVNSCKCDLLVIKVHLILMLVDELMYVNIIFKGYYVYASFGNIGITNEFRVYFIAVFHYKCIHFTNV